MTKLFVQHSSGMHRGQTICKNDPLRNDVAPKLRQQTKRYKYFQARDMGQYIPHTKLSKERF